MPVTPRILEVYVPQVKDLIELTIVSGLLTMKILEFQLLIVHFQLSIYYTDLIPFC